MFKKNNYSFIFQIIGRLAITVVRSRNPISWNYKEKLLWQRKLAKLFVVQKLEKQKLKLKQLAADVNDQLPASNYGLFIFNHCVKSKILCNRNRAGLSCSIFFCAEVANANGCHRMRGYGKCLCKREFQGQSMAII